jgi:hypothetical protein
VFAAKADSGRFCDRIVNNGHVCFICHEALPCGENSPGAQLPQVSLSYALKLVSTQIGEVLWRISRTARPNGSLPDSALKLLATVI